MLTVFPSPTDAALVLSTQELPIALPTPRVNEESIEAVTKRTLNIISAWIEGCSGELTRCCGDEPECIDMDFPPAMTSSTCSSSALTVGGGCDLDMLLKEDDALDFVDDVLYSDFSAVTEGETVPIEKCAQISDFSPEWDFIEGGAKILICLASPLPDVHASDASWKLFVQFGRARSPAENLSDMVVRCTGALGELVVEASPPFLALTFSTRLCVIQPRARAPLEALICSSCVVTARAAAAAKTAFFFPRRSGLFIEVATKYRPPRTVCHHRPSCRPCPSTVGTARSVGDHRTLVSSSPSGYRLAPEVDRWQEERVEASRTCRHMSNPIVSASFLYHVRSLCVETTTNG